MKTFKEYLNEGAYGDNGSELSFWPKGGTDTIEDLEKFLKELDAYLREKYDEFGFDRSVLKTKEPLVKLKRGGGEIRIMGSIYTAKDKKQKLAVLKPFLKEKGLKGVKYATEEQSPFGNGSW